MFPMCYTWDKWLKRLPCVTRGTSNLNVPHVLHMGIKFSYYKSKYVGPRSSACGCTCVLTRKIDHCLVTISCLPCALFCSCPYKDRSRLSDALSQALCNLPLAFLADFTLSDSTAPIRFIVKLFSLANYTLLFVWIERQDHSVHVFRLTGTAALHCGHTFVRGILTANGQYYYRQ